MIFPLVIQKMYLPDYIDSRDFLQGMNKKKKNKVVELSSLPPTINAHHHLPEF